MPFKSLPEEPRCQVVRTLDIIGEKWSLLIVRNALRGQTRFSEFREQLGIPTDVLTARLGTLVEGGILEKRSYRDPGNRERASYHLTAAGEGTRLLIAAITQWGDEFNPSPAGVVSVLVDSSNDQKVRLSYVNEAGEAVPSDQVRIAPGPAAVTTW